MDIFDVIFTAGECYSNINKDARKHKDRDIVEIVSDNVLKGKAKIDKMIEDEDREYNNRRKNKW